MLAAACFAWDYYLGFERTKIWTMAAVGCYTVLNYGMTRWTKDMERGTIYLGRSPDGKQEVKPLSLAYWWYGGHANVLTDLHRQQN